MKKNLRTRIVLLAAFSLTSFFARSQANEENSLMSYGGGTTGAGSCLFRDYQSIGVNPANLGIFADDGVVKVNFGLFESNGLFYSDALPKSQVLPSLFGRNPLTTDEKVSVAQLFLENGNSFSGEIDPVSFTVQFPKVGGFGFKWRERLSGSAILAHPLADIIFNGIESQYIDTIIIDVIGNQIGLVDDNENIADLFNGSAMKFNWLREYNISFGRKLIGNKLLTIYAGGSVKFLQSNASTDVTFDSDSISGFAAFSSLFNINYANFTDPSVQLSRRLAPVGKGLGLDFGATIVISNKFYGAVSVTDIGSIKYTGNLVTINDALTDSLVNFFGINAATIFSDLNYIYNAEGFFQYLPASERTVSLPTQIRVGGGMHLTKKVDLGFDIIQPLNQAPGTIGQTAYAGLVNILLLKNLKLSTGFMGGGISDFDVPAGISFSLVPYQIWQISIGTNDIISWIRQDRPTISLNVSLLRFHYE